VDLSVTYTGREYACDGQPFRQSIVFYPKTDACEVTVTSSGREQEREADSGAAVSRMWVYRLLDEGPVSDNDVPLPEGQPTRSASLFFPMHRFL